MRFSKIKDFFNRLPRFLAQKAFLAFLFLFFLGSVFGLIIFYKYIFLTEKAEIEILEAPLEFREKTYQTILKIWQEKEEKFREADFKQYPDLFREKKEIEFLPEEPEPEKIPEFQAEKKEYLLAAKTLYEFYRLKGEALPPIWQRAKIWEEKGLGAAFEYHGLSYQNQRLLEVLKKELTE